MLLLVYYAYVGPVVPVVCCKVYKWSPYASFVAQATTHRVPTRYRKSIELWNRFSRP